jgi:hypothetical protein
MINTFPRTCNSLQNKEYRDRNINRKIVHVIRTEFNVIREWKEKVLDSKHYYQ